MTIVGLFWPDTSGTDLHLLPGQSSPEYHRLLWGTDQDAAGNLNNEHIFSLDVDRKFSVDLVGGPTAHGLTVVETTGKVSVTSAAMAGRTFHLNVEATDRTPGTGKATNRLRIHVHQAIDRIWLTPAPLTVRRGSAAARPTVFARFTDGVVADITNWAPFVPADPLGIEITYVHATAAVDVPALAWTPVPPGQDETLVGIHPQTGVLTIPADTGKGRVTVTYAAAAKSDTATVRFDKPWNTPLKLDLVEGPGVAQRGAVPNILFLPDGWAADERAAYERHVRIIAKRLNSRNRTRPFSALAGRINYWSGWLPSREPGVSVHPEVASLPNFVDPTDGSQRAEEVELPSGGNLDKPVWTLRDIIEGVGMPIPNDPDPTLTAARVSAWQAIYPKVTRNRVVTNFQKWIDGRFRTTIDHRDTALHMGFGNFPQIDASPGDVVLLEPNIRLVTDADLNAFFGALQGPKGESMSDGRGPFWNGKDKDLVVILCRSSHQGGVAGFRQISATVTGRRLGLSLAARSFHQVVSIASGQTELKPDTVPTDVFFSVWLTCAHELGHAFRLGDEYGINTAPASPARIASVADTPNVQDIASVSSGTPKVLDPDRIKWAKWPRIAKAGLLIGQPTPINGAPGRYTLLLKDARASRLAVGDIVRLRKRPLVTAGAPSPRLKVDSVDRANAVLTVTQLEGAAITPATFPAGSIVMAPVRKPDPNPGNNVFGTELMLADPSVLDRIRVTRNPLNADAGEPVNRPPLNKKLDVPTPAKNFLPGTTPNPPPFSSWIVGLYDNGATHTAGFFRPTGICMMSDEFETSADGGPKNLYDYCIVCRYAFVDDADPTGHASVEVDFVGRYGKQGAR